MSPLELLKAVVTKGKKEKNPHKRSFANFINLSGIKARKFFKN